MRRGTLRGLGIVIALAIAGATSGVPAPAAGAGRGIRLDRLELDLLHAINAWRAQHGRARLHVSRALIRAADANSVRMARARVFGHQASGGWARRIRSRFDADAVGEVLGLLSGSAREDDPAAELLAAWSRSAPHRLQLLSARYRYVGISRRGATYRGVRQTVVTIDLAGPIGRRRA